MMRRLQANWREAELSLFVCSTHTGTKVARREAHLGFRCILSSSLLRAGPPLLSSLFQFPRRNSEQRAPSIMQISSDAKTHSSLSVLYGRLGTEEEKCCDWHSVKCKLSIQHQNQRSRAAQHYRSTVQQSFHYAKRP